jgi:EmrB/QacA subfamily drug resistance transporter
MNSSSASEDGTNPSDPVYEKRWKILAAISMGVFLATIDASIVNVALPTLEKAFTTRFAVIQWIPLAYMLTVATLILSMGRLGDLKGKKKIYLSGMAVFTIGSISCGLSQSVYMLISFRILQAVGAAMMASLSTAIVTEAFPDSERGKALGTIGGIVAIGIIAGPAMGGILVDVLSWHWIFFVNVPISIAGLYLVNRHLPDFKSETAQQFDFGGAGLMFVSVTSFLLALTVGQSRGFGDPVILALFGIWAVSFCAFIAVENRVAHPMIDLRLFRNRIFSLNLFSGFLSFVSTAGVVLLMPFYLENVLGYDPHQVGLLLAVVPISAGIASPLAGMLSDRVGSRPIATLGLFVLLIGFYALTTLSDQTTALGYILRFIPVGLGLGIFQSPNNSAIMGAAPKERLGTVSGLLSITRTLGQTSGIAALGAVWAARVAFYTGMHGHHNPTDMDIAAQVSGLQDTLIVISVMIAVALIGNFAATVIKWQR